MGALPELNGEFPVAALADEIVTPGRGQIRALLTVAGNPVLSNPNGRRLDDALAGLDFMASIDFYLNETTRHAHLILPPATSLSDAHYPLLEYAMAVRNVARYARPLFALEPGARAIGNSPLVKCALHGGDPNWGRILQAAGQALPEGSDDLDLEIEGVSLVERGDDCDLSAAERDRLHRHLGGAEHVAPVGHHERLRGRRALVEGEHKAHRLSFRASRFRADSPSERSIGLMGFPSALRAFWLIRPRSGPSGS